MTSPSLALQVMMRARLIADPAVTALVPANAISERRGLPSRFPSVVFGEAREYVLGAVKRESTRVHLDVHVWCDEPGTAQAKRIADAVRRALRGGPWDADGQHVMEFAFASARYMPDPESPDVTHGLLTFEAHTVELEDA